MLLSQIKYKLLSSAANLIRQNNNNNNNINGNVNNNTFATASKKTEKQKQQQKKRLVMPLKIWQHVSGAKRTQSPPPPLPTCPLASLTLLSPLPRSATLLQHLLAAHCRRILFSQSIRRSTNNNDSNTNENSFSAATALPQSVLPLSLLPLLLPLFKEQCNLVERPFIHIAHAHTLALHTAHNTHSLTHVANSRRRVA